MLATWKWKLKLTRSMKHFTRKKSGWCQNHYSSSWDVSLWENWCEAKAAETEVTFLVKMRKMKKMRNKHRKWEKAHWVAWLVQREMERSKEQRKEELKSIHGLNTKILSWYKAVEAKCVSKN